MTVLDLAPPPVGDHFANSSTCLLDDLVAARQNGRERPIAAAERAIVLEYLPVATSIASRHLGRGVDVEDLVQVARLGLLKAVRGWRPRPTGGFLQYAVPMMHGEIQRHIRDRSTPIRIPRRVHELRPTLIEARNALERNGQSCTPSAIARAADVDIEDVREHLAAPGRSHPHSLHAIPDVDDRADLMCHQSELARAVVEDRSALRAGIQTLTHRERQLLALRFFHDRTQQEIADELGLSQMQISRLLTRIFAKLRVVLADGQASERHAS